MSVRNFQVEAFGLMQPAYSASNSGDQEGALWDAAKAVGVAMKDADKKTRNYEIALIQLIRLIRAERWPQATDQAEKAAELLAKHGGNNPLR